MKVPLMRILVIPNSYEDQPNKYMNDWYFNSVFPQKGLNKSVASKVDELTKGITDPAEITRILYNYVRENFKYVAIEIGMGAFIPTHVNEVFLNKQGDCKDLSNFLSEVLTYKGIESDLALAATFDHISDCDFPSLSSANHVICVAYINDEEVLLDPTDPIHQAGTPVQSLQDRTILIVNSDGGKFYDVDPFSPEKNRIHYNLDLTLNSSNDQISGSFNIDYEGTSGNLLRRTRQDSDDKEFKDILKTFYEEVFGNQTISNISFQNNSEKLNFTGNITVDGKTFSDTSTKYLFIDFLPKLMENESRETLIDGTYIGNPFSKIASVTISIDEPIEPFEDIEKVYEQEGVSLKVLIKAISNKQIECRYDFTFDYIFVDKENMEATNEILTTFKNIINEPIVLNKQKE